ncbi:MAG: hypothetical protein A3J65_03105 [Candidatus Buchananbacteria bacterium RIFCSPHIGHO2_02_FULL_45_11b]|uniref:Uncharacterized protein n=4 Tax=Candidatus Buchananiibacteriota TaxID=1817903 RepID=A0A1G1YP63_9BACT|nr:MAG: hypothetical protein A2663_04650 [Candidatus Buchananbacteria bacterium RIFCSPHIGHO2_01_FULL_46_12]OGY50916.1 MAG: hypothetical protein A3J65_03105 [Candidatus Buchananbacteria bacterium RIFCSPHIGHO2_02_FULL_45_11b]OGY54145.1 MAG: hypothetical protein A3B15_01190 [Candidatus Buchananbacteria bacterium RIFCSPLOWO2_01_FULL_45_31]OGY56629.1 MAG: hypothetical protein A3H67_04885 [Candidatus Buchananbacteria bacterium RIFCSPLOWO2_02_FULL_46_11b]
MSAIKKMKDNLLKIFWGNTVVPRGLFELNQYFRLNGPIAFNYERKDGLIVACSNNFRHGSIITSGQDETELDKNIKDAILTSFEVPSSYAKEAKIAKSY